MGNSGSHCELTRNGATARSIEATRRVASASRGVMPFQMLHTFSQLSQPTPLKNANWRSEVLSRFQRSLMLTMWRGSSHLYLSTMGMNGKLYWPQFSTFHASASSLGLPSGSKARGWPAFSAASENPSGTPSCVSPLMPSAPICFISPATASGHGCEGSCVPWSHIIIGNSTRTPRRWKSATICRTPSIPPGMDPTISSWLRSSMPMFGYVAHISTASMPP